MIGFCPLASGSKGNALYIGTKQTKVIIDAGVSLRYLKTQLERIQVDLSEIDAILVTHEHHDHISGLSLLGAKMGFPVFANGDTAQAIYETLKLRLKFKLFTTGEPFEFGDLEFRPFSIQHDAIDPVGFTIQTGGVKVGVCADLGFATSAVVSELQRCDFLYIEANHHVDMVHACCRPAVYKQRVLSRMGHLSNRQCAELVTQVVHPGLKHIYLAHLSSECNSPDLALKMIREALDEKDSSCSLSIAYQDRLSQPALF